MPSSGVPAGGVPLCTVSQGAGDVVQAGIDDSACQDSAIWLESVPDDLESELVQARERDQSAQGKVPIGTWRPSAIRGMRRCGHASRGGRVQASAPEFGELLGQRSALVVTGSSGRRTQR
jgi:hypothetical protein